ncbi:MAG: G1 family glutamic endopeptidase [Hyphomicrobiaceae bacterium]|nr:hypothetical protein [Hyphomicrobiaceae bacterium]
MEENIYYDTSYDVVTAGQDLLAATPAQLDKYGIPQRPDAAAGPHLYDFWKKLVSPRFSAKRPTFSSSLSPVVMGLREGRMETKVVPSRRGTLESSLNWSGAVISPPFPKRIVFAVGSWKVPNVTQPSEPALFTHSNDAKSLVWVGIDGHNGRLRTASLPQIGTAQSPDGENFAWWFWWSKSSDGPVLKIDDFPIAPGDEILAGLEVLTSEDVMYFIKNQSSGEYRSFLGKRQAHKGPIEPLGSTAEWVMERPTDPYSKLLHPLAAYDPVDFKYCLALAADRPNAQARLVTLADNGRMIKMREAFASPYRTVYVSRAKRRHDPDGSIGVTCTFQDPAWP